MIIIKTTNAIMRLITIGVLLVILSGNIVKKDILAHMRRKIAAKRINAPAPPVQTPTVQEP